MNLAMVKEVLYDIASMFFQGAPVIWAEQMNTKPTPPYITLKVGNMNRTHFPLIGEGGNRYYPCSTTVEINLYTKGKPVIRQENATGNFMNTAVSDLNDFFQFVESDEITDLLAGKGMDVSLIPPVRDLTGLENDSHYRYRSMAEATVSFPQEAGGLYAIGGMPDVPNYSGGGTAEMAEVEGSVIESIEMEESNEGGIKDNEK